MLICLRTDGTILSCCFTQTQIYTSEADFWQKGTAHWDVNVPPLSSTLECLGSENKLDGRDWNFAYNRCTVSCADHAMGKISKTLFSISSLSACRRENPKHCFQLVHLVLVEEKRLKLIIPTYSKNLASSLQAEVFERAGFASGQQSTGISVFLGFFKLIATGRTPFIGFFASWSEPAQKLCYTGLTSDTPFENCTGISWHRSKLKIWWETRNRKFHIHFQAVLPADRFNCHWQKSHYWRWALHWSAG